jgi:hypothetical protein
VYGIPGAACGRSPISASRAKRKPKNLAAAYFERDMAIAPHQGLV